MSWSNLVDAPPPLSMPGLLAVSERWQPGATADFEPASAEQIAALAAPHGGVEVLPRIYRAFLETMGASTGALRLTWGSTAIADLLEDLADATSPRADPRRYLKFAIGEDDYNERQPDDFFDLSQPTPDRLDAAVLRVHESVLARGELEPERPFASFSDLIRTVVTTQLGLRVNDDPGAYMNFSRHPGEAEKVHDLLARLGFSYTELGASIHCVPLESAPRGAVALLLGPSSLLPHTRLRLRARDPLQLRQLQEIIADHQHAQEGT